MAPLADGCSRQLEYVRVGRCVDDIAVIIPSDLSKSSTEPNTTSRVVTRLSLLDNVIKARAFAERSQADKVLVEANRWLRNQPFDVRVMEARSRLRAVHPVDINDTGKADRT